MDGCLRLKLHGLMLLCQVMVVPYGVCFWIALVFWCLQVRWRRCKSWVKQLQYKDLRWRLDLCSGGAAWWISLNAHLVALLPDWTAGWETSGLSRLHPWTEVSVQKCEHNVLVNVPADLSGVVLYTNKIWRDATLCVFGARERYWQLFTELCLHNRLCCNVDRKYLQSLPRHNVGPSTAVHDALCIGFSFFHRLYLCTVGPLVVYDALCVGFSFFCGLYLRKCRLKGGDSIKHNHGALYEGLPFIRRLEICKCNSKRIISSSKHNRGVVSRLIINDGRPIIYVDLSNVQGFASPYASLVGVSLSRGLDSIIWWSG